MADTAIFASAFIVKTKAGSAANTTAIASELLLNTLAQQAESYINARTMYNWSDTYATLNADVKYILQECASNIQAMYVIQYDMSGYTSRSEAQTMLNVLRDRVEADIEVLKEIAKRDFIQGA
jgi:uncharacterized protein involved in tolerance to divalent cations